MPTYWPMQKSLLKFNIIPILIHFVIKDRFGYQSPKLSFLIFSQPVHSIPFDGGGQLIGKSKGSERTFSNRTTSRSFSLCIFSTLYAFHSDNRKIAGVLRILQGSVLRACLVAPRRKAGAAQIPVQTCRTIGFHCHKIQNIRPSTIKRSGISSRIIRVNHLPTIRIIKKSSHSLSNE